MTNDPKQLGQFSLYQTYLIGDSSAAMCIGLDQENGLAVLAPYYSDDIDCLPELHVEDGVDVYDATQTHDNIKPVIVFKKDFVRRLTLEIE